MKVEENNHNKKRQKSADVGSVQSSVHLHEVVNGLQVEEVVVGDVDADAEVESRVPPVDDLVVAELNKVGVLRVTD